MSLHLFEIVQGFCAVLALALIGIVAVAAVHAAGAVAARFGGRRQREPAPAMPRPQLRLVPAEPKPERKPEPKPAPKLEAPEDVSEWLKEFG